MGDLNAVYAVGHPSPPTLVRRILANSVDVAPRVCFSPHLYDRDVFVIITMVHFSRLHLNDDYVLVQRADALYESLGVVVSAKKCGRAFEHEVWGGQLDGKRGKLGFGVGRPVSLVLATVTGAVRGLSGVTFDDSSVCGCTHSPSGAKRCPLCMCHSWKSNISRHDVVAPSTVLSRRAACVYFSRASLGRRPLCARRQSFRRQSLLDACVSRALDPSLGFLRGSRVLSEVGLGHELAARTGTSRLAGGGCRVGG